MLEIMTVAGISRTPAKPLYAELLPSDFITGTALASLTAMSTIGTAQPEIDTTPWLVFRETTKVYCMPKKPLKNSVSYTQLNNAGLWVGKNVTIKGGVWKVRGFTGLGNASEWVRFMGGFISGGSPPTRWASFSYVDIGMAVTTAASSWIQETESTFLGYRRGQANNYAYMGTSENIGNGFSSCGWRPLLEWVSGAQPWV